MVLILIRIYTNDFGRVAQSRRLSRKFTFMLFGEMSLILGIKIIVTACMKILIKGKKFNRRTKFDVQIYKEQAVKLGPMYALLGATGLFSERKTSQWIQSFGPLIVTLDLNKLTSVGKFP